MNLFKKRMKKTGKGTDKPVSFRKEFDVLNCTPMDYQYTTRYVHFMNHAESIFGKLITRIAVDELCSEMFDAYIDSIMEQMRSSVREQYTHHMHLINHHKGILEGELVLAKGHLNDLKYDLEDIEREKNNYRQLKEEKNIL